MKPNTIVKNLSATIEIDPEEERMRAIIEAQKSIIDRAKAEVETKEGDEREAAEEAIKAAVVELGEQRKILDDYKACDDTPRLTIGYIPPSKLSEIQSTLAMDMADIDLDGKDTKEEIKAIAIITESNRELIRWGLRGWNAKDEAGQPTPFGLEEAEHRGRPCKVAEYRVVETIELMGWLGIVADCIKQYNTLSTTEKKR